MRLPNDLIEKLRRGEEIITLYYGQDVSEEDAVKLQDAIMEKYPECDVEIVISNYEEIGFGASYIPQEITEFVAVDMGAVGADLAGDERKVSICAKESSGPYDYELTGKLIAVAKERSLDYVVDVFPY